MRLAVATWLGLALVGCQCEPGGATPVFACASDADCLDGFVCGVVSRTCVTMVEDAGSAGGGSGQSGGGVGGSAGGVGGGAGGGVALGPNALVFLTTTVPSPLLAGECVVSSLQARRGTVATPVAAATTVGLSEFPVATLRHYSDSNCTVPITVATIPAGQTNIDFYVKPLTGGASSQIATAAFGSAQRQFQAVIGAVRRGTCNFPGPVNLADGGQTQDTVAFCAINPPHQSMGKTALFFQATTASSGGSTSNVRCRLTATNQVGCIRFDGLSSGIVAWQTVELPTAMRVERVSGACQSPPFNITLPAAVSPSSSFLLKSFYTSSGDIDDEDLFTTQLTSGTNVVGDLGDDATACNGSSYEVQAVELQGLAVTRGTVDAGIASGDSVAPVNALPTTSLNSAVLTQHRVTNLSPALNCSVFVRSELPSAMSIGFSRNLGMDGGCVAPPVYQLIWERLDFGTRGNV